MIIKINQDPIDFTIEKETTVGEIVDQLQKWLEKQDFFIEHITLDDQDVYLYDREMWEGKDLKQLNEIDLNVITGVERKLLDLDILEEFFNLYIKALQKGNSNQMIELGKEYHFVKESLANILNLTSFILETQLFAPMENSGVLLGTPKEEFRQDLMQRWNDILNLIKSSRSELLEPLKEAQKTIDTLIGMKDNLSQVPLYFQQNKDRDALDLIIVLSELLFRVFRILKFINNIELSSEQKEFHDSLKSNLEELSQALESEDTILMGDLIEYEILEKLDDLPKLFEGVNKA